MWCEDWGAGCVGACVYMPWGGRVSTNPPTYRSMVIHESNHQSPTATNQDRHEIRELMGGDVFCGVFDGHGGWQVGGRAGGCGWVDGWMDGGRFAFGRLAGCVRTPNRGHQTIHTCGSWIMDHHNIGGGVRVDAPEPERGGGAGEHGQPAGDRPGALRCLALLCVSVVVGGGGLCPMFDGCRGIRAPSPVSLGASNDNNSNKTQNSPRTNPPKSLDHQVSKALVRAFERTDRGVIQKVHHAFEIGLGNVAKVRI